MSILILMVPMAITVSLIFTVGFIWAARSGQFDDLETPSHRILYDENHSHVKKRKEIGVSP